MQTQSAVQGALSRMKPFRNVPDETVQELEKSCKWLRVRRKQMLLAGGGKGDHVYFIAQGHVRCAYHSASGRLVTLAELGPGEMVGELAAIDGLPRTVDVVALVESVVAVMPTKIFRDALFRHEEVAQGVLSDIIQRIRVLTDRMVELSTLEVGVRVRSELLRIAERYPVRGKAVAFPAPHHADLASRVSANREAVTREMSKLTRAGFLEKQNRCIVIRNLGDFQQSLSDMVSGLPRAAEQSL